MRRIISTLALLVTVNGKSASSPGCLCPMVYAPVKCDNGNAYSNDCLAKCDSAENCKNEDLTTFPPTDFPIHGHTVPMSCMCMEIYQPVKCGETDFSNMCKANCKGFQSKDCRQLTTTLPTTTSLATPEFSLPPKVCVCPSNYQPVKCGNTQFSNMCQARCKGVNEISCKEVKTCACPRLYSPVICGKNKVEYPNTCEAECQDEVGCILASDAKICEHVDLTGKKGKGNKKKCGKYMKISKKVLKEETKKKPSTLKLKKWKKVMKVLGKKLSSSDKV